MPPERGRKSAKIGRELLFTANRAKKKGARSPRLAAQATGRESQCTPSAVGVHLGVLLSRLLWGSAVISSDIASVSTPTSGRPGTRHRGRLSARRLMLRRATRCGAPPRLRAPRRAPPPVTRGADVLQMVHQFWRSPFSSFAGMPRTPDSR